MNPKRKRWYCGPNVARAMHECIEQGDMRHRVRQDNKVEYARGREVLRAWRRNITGEGSRLFTTCLTGSRTTGTS